jgi:chromosome segregation ATPase
MSFTHNAVAIAPVDPKDAEKKKRETITMLGIKIDEAKNELDTFESKEVEVKKLDKEIEKNKAILSTYHNDITSAKKELKELNAGIENSKTILSRIEKDVEKEKENAEQVSSRNKKSEAAFLHTKNGYADTIAELRKEEAELDKNNKQVKKDEKILGALVTNNKAEAERLETKLKTLTKENKEVESNLREAVKDYESAVSSIEIENKLFETAQKKREKLLTETKDLQAKLTLEQNIFDNSLKEQKIELEKREGELHLRETWLKEKGEELHKMKETMEKFFGKTININV